MRKFLRWWQRHVATIALTLAVGAGGSAIYFNTQTTEALQRQVDAGQQVACQRQIENGDVWHRVMGFIAEASPQPPTQGFIDFENKVFKLVDKHPACHLPVNASDG